MPESKSIALPKAFGPGTSNDLGKIYESVDIARNFREEVDTGAKGIASLIVGTA